MDLKWKGLSLIGFNVRICRTSELLTVVFVGAILKRFNADVMVLDESGSIL